MTHFVVVPGAWLGAWAWDEVAAELRAAGDHAHPVGQAAERIGDRVRRVVYVDASVPFDGEDFLSGPVQRSGPRRDRGARRAVAGPGR
ncbi:hypothetical protein ACK389_12005 [Streptomyces antibioticus]|uniref:hypothetical protein n=1 Tax=Streptomyces antibioticus TaxID=1890 RepID=UPI0026AC84B6